MKKINVPGNIEISKNAERQIQEIEKNGNYNSIVPKINEFLRFVSESPTDIQKAIERGYTIEKLKTGNKGSSIYSIRITRGDRFTYEVDENGKVTILGVLGHYKGVNLSSRMISNYGLLLDSAINFFVGELSFYEMMTKFGKDIVVLPMINDMTEDNLLSLKDKLLSRRLIVDDVDYLEFIIDNNHIYFSKSDLLELYSTYEDELHFKK